MNLDDVYNSLMAGYYGDDWRDHTGIGSIPDVFQRVYRDRTEGDAEKLDKFLSRAKQENSQVYRQITFCSDSLGQIAVVAEQNFY